MYCFSNFCFLCLSNNNKLINLNTSDQKISLREKLAYCISDLVYVQDPSDIKVCKVCCDILRMTYEFKTRCLQNNKILIGYAKLLLEKQPIYAKSLVILDDDEHEKCRKKCIEAETRVSKAQVKFNQTFENKSYLRKLNKKDASIMCKLEPDPQDERGKDVGQLTSSPSESKKLDEKYAKILGHRSLCLKIPRLNEADAERYIKQYEEYQKSIQKDETMSNLEQDNEETTLLFSETPDPLSIVDVKMEDSPFDDSVFTNNEPYNTNNWMNDPTANLHANGVHGGDIMLNLPQNNYTISNSGFVPQPPSHENIISAENRIFHSNYNYPMNIPHRYWQRNNNTGNQLINPVSTYSNAIPHTYYPFTNYENPVNNYTRTIGNVPVYQQYNNASKIYANSSKFVAPNNKPPPLVRIVNTQPNPTGRYPILCASLTTSTNNHLNAPTNLPNSTRKFFLSHRPQFAYNTQLQQHGRIASTPLASSRKKAKGKQAEVTKKVELNHTPVIDINDYFTQKNIDQAVSDARKDVVPTIDDFEAQIGSTPIVKETSTHDINSEPSEEQIKTVSGMVTNYNVNQQKVITSVQTNPQTQCPQFELNFIESSVPKLNKTNNYAPNIAQPESYQQSFTESICRSSTPKHYYPLLIDQPNINNDLKVNKKGQKRTYSYTFTPNNGTNKQLGPAGTSHVYPRPNLYRCYICNETKQTVDHLLAHMETKHVNHVIRRCKQCPRIFTNVDAYEKHRQTVHP